MPELAPVSTALFGAALAEPLPLNDQRIASDNRKFWILVLEGWEGDFHNEGWTPDWINDDEASDLLGLLVGFLGNDLSWDLIRCLQRKLGHQQPH